MCCTVMCKTLIMCLSTNTIPYFTDCEPLVTFKNCKHHMSLFISRSISQLISCFILMNIFSIFLVESVYPWMYSVFRHRIYTVQLCSHLCMADAERFFAMRKCITAVLHIHHTLKAVYSLATKHSEWTKETERAWTNKIN